MGDARRARVPERVVAESNEKEVTAFVVVVLGILRVPGVGAGGTVSSEDGSVVCFLPGLYHGEKEEDKYRGDIRVSEVQEGGSPDRRAE